MSEPCIMFGLGAAKAGTSWLYSYLQSHPDCFLRGVKELRYFDTVYHDGYMSRMDAMIKERSIVRERMQQRSGEKLRATRKVVADMDKLMSLYGRGYADMDAYLAYLRGDGDVSPKLVADISPDYGLLPASEYRKMQDIAPKVKFVFLMRDPVDQVWSNIRMMAGWKNPKGAVFEVAALDMFDRFLKGKMPDVSERVDYASVLAKLDDAVKPENQVIGYFETLFQDQMIEKLCRFLGISNHPANFSKRVHVSNAAQLDTGRRMAGRKYLAKQYEAVEQRFGALPDKWQNTLEAA